MDVSPASLLKNLVPQLPAIVLTSISALLGRTENSLDQDAVTQIVVAAARPILRTPASIARSQRVWTSLGWWASLGMDMAGRMGMGWLMGLDGVSVRHGMVSVQGINGRRGGAGEVKSDAVDEGGRVFDVTEAVRFAFDVLLDPRHESVKCPVHELRDVETEWTSCRADGRIKTSIGDSHTNHPTVNETVKLPKSRMVPNPRPVILYLHGGAHCLMDPTTHRWTTSTLSKLSFASVCSVRFRLSPQHPFPAALLDAFIAYLDLLSPSPAADHPAIPATQIVIAGDSSGGGLGASLLLLLLTLSRNQIGVRFHDRTINISSPPCAGLALTSPWLDITRSLPSTSKNSKWDIIAPPPVDSASPPFPPDETWPTTPPRAETYCSADICTHPLVSPLAASSSQWLDAPPVWVCAGWEGFTDEIEVFARRVYESSDVAKVCFEGWEGMPHCFGMMPWSAAGWEALFAWAGFCERAVVGNEKRCDVAVWRGTVGKRKGIKREVQMGELGCEVKGVGYERQMSLTDTVVDLLMDNARSWRVQLETKMLAGRKDTHTSAGV